ncbi:MAG: peptidase domain-containing ABC transporter [Leptolyngbya sp. Prado105]|jgi:ATP-binding cassette subfamily B protein|nr:peptidase domain-containing ABC transporter [Leptolyngbya sp. Prado105]
MKKNLAIGRDAPPVDLDSAQVLLSEILVTRFSVDPAIARSFKFRAFQLGDSLAVSNFTLLCQGRVRLIRAGVPASVLEVGESWGADEQLTESLSYQAIAASAGFVAECESIPPELRTVLEKLTQSRQQLLFLKSETDLRSHSSHALKKLLPYLCEIRIPAGSNLAQSTTNQTGHFWLRQGQIQGNPSPKIGQEWQQPVPADWIATTEVLLYHIRPEHWNAAFNPELSSEIKPIVQPLIRSHSVEVQPVQPTPAKPAAIEFAKPRRSRIRMGRSPFIAQQSSSDCGAACLAMIAQYWGKKLSINMLRNLAGVGRSGASLKGLALAAESLGFQARPVRSSFNRMAEQPSPWIAHWQGEHYIVVYRVKRGRVILCDPALGRRSISCEEFQANWTGYALLLNPTELLRALPKAKPSLGRFLGAFTPYRSMLGSIILASALLQIFGLVTPLFTQIILDQVVVHKSLPTLQIFIFGLVLFGTWKIGLTCIRQYLLDFFSNQVDLTLISGFIAHALNLPLQFFATRHVGDIVTRVQENHKIQLFLTRQAVTAWLDAVMAIVYVGLMLHYNWQLSLLVLGLIPPIVLMTVIASPFLRQMSRQIFHESAKQNSTLVEMLTGISTVKVTASERELRWQWEDELTSMFNAQFRGQKLANGLQGASAFVNLIGSTLLLWYGAKLVIADQLTIGQLVAFNMMIGSVITPVLSLVGLWDEFQEVLVSIERLDDIFSAQPEEHPDQPLLVLPRIQGEVTFENVTFRYHADDSRNILQNISFTARAGDTIALVGRSGSGKTTLANLLQALYHPTSGRILIDKTDLHHVSPQSLRSQLGIVPQECFLFSGTILDNITLYRPQYNLEDVLKVAKLAEAHAFIQSLPLGYQTKVGERGTMLSGGQRQRIAIARALLNNPRILLLDEATSSLDTESERRFQKNLQQISRDRTTFIIAHRLSTVRNADCILVLDKGIIAEQGTHEQLIQQGGLYAQLAQQQLDL